MNDDVLTKSENGIMMNINSMGDEVMNVKDTVIKRLLQENERLRQIYSSLENKLTSSESSLNQLGQYGRGDNIVISGVLDDITDDQLEEAIVKILVDVDDTAEESDMRLAVDSISHVKKL